MTMTKEPKLMDDVNAKPTIKSMLSLEFGKNYRQLIMLAVLIGICLVFGALTGGTFISARNITNVFLQSAAIGIAAIAMVWVLVAGQIDLSVGSFVGCMGAISAVLMVQKGLPVVPAIIITLAVGAVFGALSGRITPRISLSYIVMLTMSFSFMNFSSHSRLVLGISI